MTAWPPLFPLTYWVALGVGAIVVTWVASSLAVRRARWPLALRATVVSVFHGPVSVVIAATTAAYAERTFWQASPSAYPGLLAPAAVVVYLELLVIWSIVAVAAGAVRRHVLTERHPSGRYLVLGVYSAGLLGLVYVVLNSPALPPLEAGVWSTFGFVTGVVATYIAVHIINIALERYFHGYVAQRPHLQTIYTFVRRLVLAGVALIGVAASAWANFPEATGAVTSLVLAAGFLSIVIGLAAQSTIANMVAGAMISLSQPFELGDAVVFPYPNGDWCFVEDIRLTFTVLRTWDLRRLMVPNSMFQSGVLVNYSAVDPTMLVIVALEITYESDVDRAREIMADEARRHPDRVPLGNLPVTHVMAYGASGVQLRLLSAAKDQPTAFEMEKALLASIRTRFQAEGIGLPYPTRRVLLERVPEPVPERSGDRSRGGSRAGVRRTLKDGTP